MANKQPGGTDNLWWFLLKNQDIVGFLRRIIPNRTPEEKLLHKLDKLDDEEQEYRERLARREGHRKHLDWATYETLMKEVDRKRKQLRERLSVLQEG